MSKQINVIAKFVKETKFSNEPLELSKGNTIANRRKFAESHLIMLQSGSGKKVLMPYFERLAKFKTLIENGKK